MYKYVQETSSSWSHIQFYAHLFLWNNNNNNNCLKLNEIKIITVYTLFSHISNICNASTVPYTQTHINPLFFPFFNFSYLKSKVKRLQLHSYNIFISSSFIYLYTYFCRNKQVTRLLTHLLPTLSMLHISTTFQCVLCDSNRENTM